MSVDHEVLLNALSRLKLTAIRDQLDSLLDEAAKRELTLREALAFLIEREIARKDERRVAMAVKIAHFPSARDLDGFDFAAQPSIDPRQIRELAASRWVAHGEALLLLGPPGVGKTHLAIARGRAANPRRLLGAVRDEGGKMLLTTFERLATNPRRQPRMPRCSTSRLFSRARRQTERRRVGAGRQDFAGARPLGG